MAIGNRYWVPGRFDTPTDWVGWVNAAQTEAELEALRKSVNRGTPYGSAGWRTRVANALGLESTLHPRGRARVKL